MSQTPTRFEPYTPGRPGPEAPWRPSDAVDQADRGVVRPEASRPHRYGGAPDCLVIASIVCVVVWATSGGGYFWPIWVLLPTFLPVVLGRQRSWCGPRSRHGRRA